MNDSLINQLIVALLGIIPVALVFMRNSAKERENSAKAQEMINSDFGRLNKKVDDLTAEVKVEREARHAQEIKAAQREGGLIQQIESLQNQLKEAKEEARLTRDQGEEHSRENARKIGELQGQINILTETQKQTNERLDQTVKQRDDALELVRRKNEEIAATQREKADAERRAEEALRDKAAAEEREAQSLQEKEQALTLVMKLNADIERLNQELHGKRVGPTPPAPEEDAMDTGVKSESTHEKREGP
jgi:chromosome segregation ATPase